MNLLNEPNYLENNVYIFDKYIIKNSFVLMGIQHCFPVWYSYISTERKASPLQIGCFHSMLHTKSRYPPLKFMLAYEKQKNVLMIENDIV